MCVSHRMTILYFGLSGLDVLNALDSIPAKEKQEMIDWIYAMQLLPDKDNPGMCVAVSQVCRDLLKVGINN